MIQKRVLSAAIANWIGQLVSLASGFLIAPFVLRHVGDIQYGILVLVGAVVVQGSNLDLGIRSALIKFVAEHKARGEIRELRSVIATALWLYCFLGAVAFVLTLLISPLLPDLFNVPPSERHTMIVVGILMGSQLAISIPGSTSSGVLSGLLRYDIKNAISVVWTLVSASATVVVVLAGGGVVEVAAVSTVVAIIMQLVYVLCLYRVAPHLRLTFRGARSHLVRRILAFSTSMLVMDVSTGLQTKSDEIVIGAFLPVGLVSPYSFARRLSTVPQMIAERFLWGFVPLTSHLEAQGEAERLRALYLTGTRITLALSLPFAAVIIVLAGPLLTLWIGAQYAEHAPITIILTIASILELACGPGSTILQGVGRHHRLAVISACAAVANVGLSILLVVPYGLLGVAIGTLVPTAMIALGWKLMYSLRTLQISLLELLTQGLLPVFWPFLASMVSLLIVKSAAEPSGLLSVGCAGATGIAVFLAVYLVFFSGESERQLIRDAIAAVKRRLRITQKGGVQA